MAGSWGSADVESPETLRVDPRRNSRRSLDHPTNESNQHGPKKHKQDEFPIDPAVEKSPRHNSDDALRAEASEKGVDFSALLALRQQFVQEIRGRRPEKTPHPEIGLPSWLPREANDDPPFTPGVADMLVEEEHKNGALPSCPGEAYDVGRVEQLSESHTDMICAMEKNHLEYFSGQEPDEDGMRPIPLLAEPAATSLCIDATATCHHRLYKTHDPTETNVSYRELEPENMVQILKLTLPKSYPHSTTIYGKFALRDVLHPGRNYLFNRSRDDSVTVHPGSNLPLCSPCRGIYALDRVLLDVDLWIKHEGDDKSVDEQFVVGYYELFVHCDYNDKFRHRLHDGITTHYLDVDYRYVGRGIAATVIAFADIAHPCHLKLTALTRNLNDEITMFDGTCCEKMRLRHVVAVKMLGKLELRLKLDGSCCYSHIFCAGVDTEPVVLGPVKVLVVWSIMNKDRFWDD